MTKTQEIIETLTFPYYLKYGDNQFFKIIDKYSLLSVQTYVFCTSIEISSLDQNDPFGLDGWTETTEVQFNIAKTKASKKLKSY